MKYSSFEWASLLFTGIIAIVAVVGSSYTIYSNKEVSETLKTIKDTVETYTDPIIKFNDYTWIYSGSTMNCDNPPFGINYEYKNMSNFPIKLTILGKKVLFGNINFLEKTAKTKIVFDRKDFIVAANSVIGFTVMSGNEFQHIFNNHFDIYEAPYLELHLNGTISNFSETKKYNIELIDYIGFNCKHFNIKNIINYKSSYSIILEKQNK